MPAPSSVYQTYKTRRRKAGAPDVDADLYIAKFLQNTSLARNEFFDTPVNRTNRGKCEDKYLRSRDRGIKKPIKR